MKKLYFNCSYAKIVVITIIVFAILLSFVPVFSSTTPRSERAEILESEGSLWDPFVEDAVLYADEFISSVGDAVVESMVGAFSPTFNVLLNLENGKSAIDMGRTYDTGDLYDSFTIGTLYNFARYFGLILASLILFFNLFICAMGQAEQIRDSPLRLIAKYIGAVILINMSFNIILEVVNFCSGMWTDFVLTDKVGSTLDFTNDFLDGIIQYDEYGGVASILNITISTSMRIVMFAILPIMGFYLVWKLFKQFLRLFVEIAERYFVMILLLLFLPVVIPTLISNHTRNIFSSYMRMFACQVFVMMCNSAFMKIFVYVLLHGGWTASLFNYVLALAFMRICQRIDTYMLSMGLNVAQTGGGVVGAGINAGQAISQLFGGLRSNAEARGNTGKNMMDHALNTGNYGEYIQGFSLQQASTASNIATAIPSELSFTQQMSQTPEVQAKVAQGKAMMEDAFYTGDYEQYKAGHDLTVTPFDKYTGTNNALLSEAEFNRKVASSNSNLYEQQTMSVIQGENTFDSVVSDMKIPDNVKDALTSQGVNIDEIATVKQLDDQGTAFGFYDDKGNGIGFSNNGEVETYTQRAGDLKAMELDNAIVMNNNPGNAKEIFSDMKGSNMHHQDPLLDNESILKATGEERILSDGHLNYQSFRSEYGTDTVSCVSHRLDDDCAQRQRITSNYEIKSVAAHPDVLKNSRYTKVTGQDGRLYGIREMPKKNKSKKNNM